MLPYYQSIFSHFKRKKYEQNGRSQASESQELSDHENIFFQKLLQSSEILKVTITDVEVIPKTFLSNSYALYVIQLITQQFSYQVKKRFNQFLELYQKIAKLTQIRYSFPRKTLIYSGTHEKVTKPRIQILNKFLNEIFQSRKIESYPFFEMLKFLKVKDEYQSRNISVCKSNSNSSDYNINKIHMDQESLSHQILKMNLNRDEIIKILNKTENIVANYNFKKQKIKSQQVNILLFGFEDKKGLIQLALTVQNDLTATKILKTINLWLNVETNSANEKFQKSFLTLTPNLLTLRKSSIIEQNSQFLYNYFQLIERYCSKSENQLEAILDDKILKIYQEWKMNKNKKIVNNKTIPFSLHQQSENRQNFRQKLEKVNCEKIFKDNLYLKNQYILNKFCKTEESQIGIAHSKNKNILKIFIRQSFSQKQKWKKIIKNESWNPLLKESIIDEYTNIQRQVFKLGKKQQKVLKFIIQENESMKSDRKQSAQTTDDLCSVEQNDTQYEQYRILKKPASEQSNSNSFFQISEMIEKGTKVQILIFIYFHQQSIKSYFQTEIEGRTLFIWNNICQLSSSKN